MAFRAFATIVALLLSACSATISLPVAQLTPTPPERVTWKDSIATDAGTLLIARDAGLHGSAARVFVAVDGIAAGDVRVEEVLKLQVDPGRKVVSMSVYAGLGGEMRRPRSLEVTVSPGRITLLRIGFDEMAGGVSLWQEVSP